MVGNQPEGNAEQKPKLTRYSKEAPVMPTAPLSKISESPLFKELRESVAEETTAVTFACGGTIPIASSLSELEDMVPDSKELRCTSCLPIDLRWDPSDKSVEARRAKITFPLEPHTQGNLERLIQDMEPATFGRGGQNVYDESYRKAVKLDPSRFSSTFNPYELGIVDAVAQALLPSLRHSQQPRAVKAELYKLNIYSGPSGKFKAHVDTPRSPAQFGSLVICLPLQFEGGALEVRHKGKAMTFDWSRANDGSGDQPPSICWAAFYSDCEHEIFEVTEGNRFTLTYNLYSVRGNGQLGGNFPWLDPTQLPLYNTIRDLLHDNDGGLIGYNCSHVYPHTNKSKLNFLLPDNLKGADMFMYEIFASLGLRVRFRPVMSDLGRVWGNPNHGDGSAVLPIVGLSSRWKTWDRIDERFEESFDEWAGRNEKPAPDRWWETREEEEEDEETTEGRYVDFLGVHWLNDWGHQEPQITWISYGNEAENVVSYSCVTMIVEVPPGCGQEAASGVN